jgi:hypothetical protein
VTRALDDASTRGVVHIVVTSRVAVSIGDRDRNRGLVHIVITDEMHAHRGSRSLDGPARWLKRRINTL